MCGCKEKEPEKVPQPNGGVKVLISGTARGSSNDDQNKEKENG